jgi:hypothetical protein
MLDKLKKGLLLLEQYKRVYPECHWIEDHSLVPGEAFYERCNDEINIHTPPVTSLDALIGAFHEIGHHIDFILTYGSRFTNCPKEVWIQFAQTYIRQYNNREARVTREIIAWDFAIKALGNLWDDQCEATMWKCLKTYDHD